MGRLKQHPAILAAFHSLWVTGLANVGGLLTAAVLSGATTPAAILLYSESHWLPFLVTNLIAPGIRALQATQTQQKGTQA